MPFLIKLSNFILFYSDQSDERGLGTRHNERKAFITSKRLIIQPYIFYCLISPLLQVFKIRGFQRNFLQRISFMNHFRASPLPLAIAMLNVLPVFTLSEVTKAPKEHDRSLYM